MKVLLTKDVSGLGRAGDVKEVSDGHARNFLIPRHLALPATSAVLQKVQKEEAEHQAKLKRQQEQIEQFKLKLENKIFNIKAKAQKEHLFAAIKNTDIANAINAKMNLSISPDQIVIEKPIKSLGSQEALIRLAPGQTIKVKLDIESYEKN
ncbi:MAG TPA: 50S ribosomal protein L9 [Methylomirabilota bacterium]|jgi:large subunit ribosomal protein L9|nr:50S ribosomal protein L9 [Methylomirabilota bacterium]